MKRGKSFLSRKMVAFLVLLVALAVVGTAIFFVATNVITSYEMPMKVNVISGGNKVGFDLNTSIVTFGKMRPGGSMDRYFNVTNNRQEPIKVVVKTFGPMADWVTVTPSKFILTPQQWKQDFMATCLVPYGTAPGNYTGTLRVYIMKP